MRLGRRATVVFVSSTVLLIGAMCGGGRREAWSRWETGWWETGLEDSIVDLEPALGGIEIAYSFGGPTCSEVGVHTVEVELEGTADLGPVAWPCDDEVIRWLNLEAGPYAIALTAYGDEVSYALEGDLYVVSDQIVAVPAEFISEPDTDAGDTDAADTDLVDTDPVDTDPVDSSG